jgi:enoyl-CoA hydratase
VTNDSPRVLTERNGAVAVLTVDDAARRNSLSEPLCDAIVSAMDELEADPDVHAVVVTGAPPAFCAGADLSRLGSSRREGLLAIYEGFLRVARSPLPTIAAVNGAAVGAGMNLALACDVRLAGRSARFDTRFLDLGIHPGGGNTWMMRNIAGLQTTMATVVFGEALDGEAAERVGLVWRCVDDDELIDRAVEMATRAASAPPELTAVVKRTILDMAAIDDHDAAVQRELRDQLWSMDQPAFAERLSALQKRISSSDR